MERRRRRACIHDVGIVAHLSSDLGACRRHATSHMLILTLLKAIAEMLHAADAVDDVVISLVDAPANSVIQTDSSRAIRLLTNVQTGRLRKSTRSQSLIIIC